MKENRSLILNSAELNLLSGLHLLPRALYIEIRLRMDAETRCAGKKFLISWPVFENALKPAPYPGVTDKAPDKHQIRRAAIRLEKLGLIKIMSDGNQLIIECPLAPIAEKLKNTRKPLANLSANQGSPTPASILANQGSPTPANLNSQEIIDIKGFSSDAIETPANQGSPTPTSILANQGSPTPAMGCMPTPANNLISNKDINNKYIYTPSTKDTELVPRAQEYRRVLGALLSENVKRAAGANLENGQRFLALLKNWAQAGVTVRDIEDAIKSTPAKTLSTVKTPWWFEDKVLGFAKRREKLDQFSAKLEIVETRKLSAEEQSIIADYAEKLKSLADIGFQEKAEKEKVSGVGDKAMHDYLISIDRLRHDYLAGRKTELLYCAVCNSQFAIGIAEYTSTPFCESHFADAIKTKIKHA